MVEIPFNITTEIEEDDDAYIYNTRYDIIEATIKFFIILIDGSTQRFFQTFFSGEIKAFPGGVVTIFFF